MPWLPRCCRLLRSVSTLLRAAHHLTAHRPLIVHVTLPPNSRPLNLPCSAHSMPSSLPFPLPCATVQSTQRA